LLIAWLAGGWGHESIFCREVKPIRNAWEEGLEQGSWKGGWQGHDKLERRPELILQLRTERFYNF
jgi:hypothetical protein